MTTPDPNILLKIELLNQWVKNIKTVDDLSDDVVNLLVSMDFDFILDCLLPENINNYYDVILHSGFIKKAESPFTFTINELIDFFLLLYEKLTLSPHLIWDRKGLVVFEDQGLESDDILPKVIDVLALLTINYSTKKKQQILKKLITYIESLTTEENDVNLFIIVMLLKFLIVWQQPDVFKSLPILQSKDLSLFSPFFTTKNSFNSIKGVSCYDLLYVLLAISWSNNEVLLHSITDQFYAEDSFKALRIDFIYEWVNVNFKVSGLLEHYNANIFYTPSFIVPELEIGIIVSILPIQTNEKIKLINKILMSFENKIKVFYNTPSFKDELTSLRISYTVTAWTIKLLACFSFYGNLPKFNDVLINTIFNHPMIVKHFKKVIRHGVTFYDTITEEEHKHWFRSTSKILFFDDIYNEKFFTLHFSNSFFSCDSISLFLSILKTEVGKILIKYGATSFVNNFMANLMFKLPMDNDENVTYYAITTLFAPIGSSQLSASSNIPEFNSNLYKLLSFSDFKSLLTFVKLFSYKQKWVMYVTLHYTLLAGLINQVFITNEHVTVLLDLIAWLESQYEFHKKLVMDRFPKILSEDLLKQRNEFYNVYTNCRNVFSLKSQQENYSKLDELMSEVLFNTNLYNNYVNRFNSLPLIENIFLQLNAFFTNVLNHVSNINKEGMLFLGVYTLIKAYQFYFNFDSFFESGFENFFNSKNFYNFINKVYKFYDDLVIYDNSLTLFFKKTKNFTSYYDHTLNNWQRGFNDLWYSKGGLKISLKKFYLYCLTYIDYISTLYKNSKFEEVISNIEFLFGQLVKLSVTKINQEAFKNHINFLVIILEKILPFITNKELTINLAHKHNSLLKFVVSLESYTKMDKKLQLLLQIYKGILIQDKNVKQLLLGG